MPAADEERRVRIAHAAQDAPQVAHERHQPARPAHDAREHVVVPREVLRRAVHDEVDAERRGPAVDRRRERRVDHRLDRALRLASRARAAEIDARQVRVRRRLAQHEARLGARAPGSARDVARLEQRVGDAEALEHVRHELQRHPVAVAEQDDVLPALREREHGRRHRRHAAREERRVLGPLERGEALLDGAHGRVAVAPVLASLRVVVMARGETRDLRGVGERVRRRLHDGRRHRVVRLGLRLARVHGVGRRGGPSSVGSVIAGLPHASGAITGSAASATARRDLVKWWSKPSKMRSSAPSRSASARASSTSQNSSLVAEEDRLGPGEGQRVVPRLEESRARRDEQHALRRRRRVAAARSADPRAERVTADATRGRPGASARR